MAHQKHLAISALLAAAYFLSACATTANYRVNPRFREKSERVDTIAILPAQVKVYQIDVGGTHEEMVDWSAQARDHILSAIENELTTKLKAKVDVITEELLEENKTRWEDTRALYDAVAMMILLHTYQNPNSPEYYFEEKLQQFDYTLGSDVQALAKSASALLLVDAEDHIWTGGRVALQTLGVILGIGAAVGTGVVIIPQMGGGTGLRAALVDSATGDILWFNAVGAGAGKDLRDAASATQMVNDLFKGFLTAYDNEAK